MATRTQKAAMKAKADAAKTDKADKAPAPKAAKAKPADAKAAKPTATKAAAKPAKATKAAKAREATGEAAATPAKKPSWAERFWQAVSGRAEVQAEHAHEHAEEREVRRKQEAAAEKAREAAAAQAAKQAQHEHELAERRKAEQSRRDLKMEAAAAEKRLQLEAKEAAARKKQEAADARRAAREAEKQAERDAQEAAERAKAEKAEARRAAREAEKQAERDAQEAAKHSKTEKAESHRAQREADLAAAAAEKAAREEAQREAAEEADRKAAQAAEAKAAKAKAVAAERAEQEAAAKAEAERAKAAKAAKAEEARLAALAKEEERKAKAAKPPASTPMEHQADRLAAELASRRSKPIVIEADDEPALPSIPGVGRNRAAKEADEVTSAEAAVTEAAPPARIAEGAAAPRGLALPEQFILLALEGEWNEKAEKAEPGAFGGGLVGSLVLELVLRGRVQVQRDRLVLTAGPLDHLGLEAVAQRLSEMQDRPSLQAMSTLAKSNPELLAPFKDALKEKGYVDHASWRHMGMFHRSQMVLTDADAQERLRGKLRRAIAGGGTPDASTILALGLLDASGLFETVVPAGAVDYNRKRLNGLLAGRDVMGYAVDKEMKAVQEVAVRTVLGNVRLLTVRG